MMEQREKLIELISESVDGFARHWAEMPTYAKRKGGE